MRSTLPALLIICGLASSPPVTADIAILYTRSGMVAVSGWKLTSDWRVEGVAESGKPIAFAASEALALHCEAVQCKSDSWPRVRLKNGEVLCGRSAVEQPPGTMRLDGTSWGDLSIPLEQLAQFSVAAAPNLRKPIAPPYILLRNGDAVAGRPERIGPQELTVETEFGGTQIPRSSLATIMLAADTVLMDPNRGSVGWIELADGQRAYCESLSTDGNRVEIRRRDARCNMGRQEVNWIVWPAAALEYASTVECTREGVGYFGDQSPPRMDANAIGQPLRLGDDWFTRGFGARPRSRVVLKTGGHWAYLCGWVGLDPWLGRDGDCTASVAVDDRETLRIDLRGRQNAQRITVSLGDSRQVELKTDYGPRGDLGDYVNWCDILLIAVRDRVGKP